MEAGVRTTINTDDPSLFAIDFNDEYTVARDALGLSRQEIDNCIANARRASFFASETVDRAFTGSAAEPATDPLAT